VEREHDEQDVNIDDDASSFGSLSGWGITSAESGALPDQCDVDNNEEHNTSCTRTTKGWPVSLLTEEADGSSPSPRVSEQNSNVSDAAFEALPAWSDVENDLEYNEPCERDANIWSISSIASSDAGSL
jgi:hypothetical protein